jgi:hypothetical protein
MQPFQLRFQAFTRLAPGGAKLEQERFFRFQHLLGKIFLINVFKSHDASDNLPVLLSGCIYNYSIRLWFCQADQTQLRCARGLAPVVKKSGYNDGISARIIYDTHD